MAAKEKIVTPEFRLSFPVIWEPKAGPDGGREKYRIVMLFPKSTDLSVMKKLAFDAAVKAWGQDRTKWPANLKSLHLKTFLSTSGKDGWPFRDGDSQNLDGYAGCISVPATSTEQPGVINRMRRPIIERDEIYAGCYCMATVVAYTYEKSGNKGVSFGLRHIMKTRDGESFSGRSRAEDDFADVVLPDEDTPEWDQPESYQAPSGDEDMFK
jgi:hypothetical protein